MRLVQLGVRGDARDDAVRVLEDEGVDYVVTPTAGEREFAAVVEFPLPMNAVEDVLDRLRDAGVDVDEYAVVTAAETVHSTRFDRLVERYAAEEDEDRISRAELQTKATELVRATPTFALLTVVSGVIATAGLLLDSPAVVVGSMVIAPLIGPPMAAAVGTVVDDEELFVRGVRLQVLGVALAVIAAAAFAWFVQVANLVPPGLDPRTIPQVKERLTPDFLSLAVALGAGVAGVVSLRSGVSSALVGVMIAVALVPPAATVGIGVAYGMASVALAAAVLVAVNALSINLAAVVVLWYSGYRPRNFFRRGDARRATVKRAALLAVGILVLSVFLGGVTYDTVTNATAERRIRGAVSETLEADRYRRATLLGVTVEQSSDLPFRHPTRVIVTVGVPPGADLADLATRLDARVDDVVDRDVAVQVRVVETLNAE